MKQEEMGKMIYFKKLVSYDDRVGSINITQELTDKYAKCTIPSIEKVSLQQ